MLYRLLKKTYVIDNSIHCFNFQQALIKQIDKILSRRDDNDNYICQIIKTEFPLVKILLILKIQKILQAFNTFKY